MDKKSLEATDIGCPGCNAKFGSCSFIFFIISFTTPITCVIFRYRADEHQLNCVVVMKTIYKNKESSTATITDN